jgi:hypothetical protein
MFLLSHHRLIALFALITLVAASVMAASYIVSPDEELIRSADAIAIVTVQSGHSYFTTDGRIETSYSVRVDRAMKGLIAMEAITLVQSGGSVGDLAMISSSDPRFLPGERALLLMNQVGSDVYTTAWGELGKFSFVRDTQSRELLVRGATPGEIFGWDMYGERHVERARDAALFLEAIEAIVRGEEPSEDYLLEPVDLISVHGFVETMSVPGNDYLIPFTIGGDSRGSRWAASGFSMAGVGDQAAVANDDAAVNTALGAWNGDANSSIGIQYTGTGASGEYGDADGKNLIFFDHPNSGPLEGNVVGQANVWASSAVNSNWSDTYFSTVDCDIVMEVGLSGSVFEEVLAHEMGHCLGFRHSNDPYSGQTMVSSDALMRSSVSGIGANLRQWDRDGANHVYGSGPAACTAPAITTQPQGATITQGQSHSMSVAASGTTPFSYQWRLNGSPIGGATSSSYNTGALNTVGTYTYSVVVANACGSATSANATVTVNESTCVAPAISQHPQSQAITSGSSATLFVSATGTTPLSLQWYRGNSGETSQPIFGATSASYNTGSLTSSANYWVRIQNSCGVANSFTATVTVQAACQAPAITTQPQSTTIAPGQSALLGVSATGTSLQYQWFRGASGDTSQPVAGATGATLQTGPLQTTTQFWVRVSNSCGTLNSTAATVTVQAACQPPAITAQPPSLTINYNTSATLTVGASGSTPLSIQWYRGFEGDPSNPIPGANAASFNTGPLTATTRYFAHVSNACGAVNTSTVTVTVNPPPRRRAVRRG